MKGMGKGALPCARSLRCAASWIVLATLLGGLALVPSAMARTDSIGSGSLDRPAGGLPNTGDALNRTKWKVQVGDSITDTIVGVVDPNLDGATEADVVIKSSERGNVTVRGTKSGTTITFSWTVPANACATMVVAYGPVGSNPTGNNSNNDIIRMLFDPPGHQAIAGFAAVDGSGNVV